MKYLLIILSIVVFASCKTCPPPIIQTVIKDSVVTQVEVQTKDSLIEIPGEVLHIRDTIPCPDVVYEKEVKSPSGKTTGKVKIKDGVLDVTCESDSLKLVIQTLRREIIRLANFHTSSTEIAVPVIQKDWYIPKWVWYLVAFNVIYFGIKYRLKILSATRWLLKLFTSSKK